jgi:ribosome maturation factor RimP
VGSAHAFVCQQGEESEVADQHGDERVRSVVEPALSASGFEVVDVERHGGVLRVTVDRLVDPEGTVDRLVDGNGTVDREGGIDMDGVTEAARLVNDLVDRHDLLGSQASVEVSSPGVERPLRTPEHFRRFVGTEVAVKARPGVEGDRRLSGILETADDDGVVVAGRRLAYADIERARTVFVWPATQKKNSPSKKMGRVS